MEIYAETLFLINFSVLFLCLAPSCRAYGVGTARCASSAAAGALWASAIFIVAPDGALSKAAPTVGFFITACTAFGRKSRAYISFLVSLLLIYAAVTVLISFFGSGSNAFIKNGVIYFNVPAKIFIPVFAAVLPLMPLLERVWIRVSESRRHLLRIIKNGRSVDVIALRDSGNLLKDPRSGRHVILVSRKALLPLAPDEILTSELPLIIPYRSLGHSGAVLGFCPDKIILDQKKEIYGAVIGISEERFASDCDALIGGI